MVGRRRLGIAAFLMFGTLRVIPAVAEETECLSFGAEFRDLRQATAISLAKIGDGSSRVYFIKRDVVQKGCPSHMPTCRDKAYLVPGDESSSQAQKVSSSAPHM